MEIEINGLSIAQYAERQGVSTRTIKRWLAGNELPGAVKDAFTGEWRIPVNTSRTISASTEVASTAAGNAVAMPASWEVPGTMLATEPTRLQDLADEAAFLTVADAAQYLGIPQAQILAHPELFEVMAVGVNGSPRVPKRTVYAFEGGTR